MRFVKWTPWASALILACTATLPALAHPSLQRREAHVGAPYRAIMSIPHGCDGSATVKLRVQIPEGVIGVKPMPKPGWTISTVRGPYARSYPFYHGQTLTEGVKEIAWAGRLGDDFVDDFVFAGFLADTLPAGETLFFPTYQECEKGEWRWIEVPGPGQDAHALAAPAPGVRLLPAAQKPETRSYKVGSLLIEAPWTRATPGGAQVAGGYLKVTNDGSEPDRLVGGTLVPATTVEVHEMAMSDGIMKMRRLREGARDRAGPDRRAQARRLPPDVHGPARWAQGGPDREGQPRLREGGRRRGRVPRRPDRCAIRQRRPQASLNRQGGGAFAVLSSARSLRSRRRRPRCTSAMYFGKPPM